MIERWRRVAQLECCQLD